MKSNTVLNLEEYRKINLATITEVDDNLMYNLTKLLEYRKQYAIHIVNCEDETIFKQCIECYKYIDADLKTLLGIL